MKLWFALTENGYVTIKAKSKGNALSQALKMGIKPIAIKADSTL